MTGRAARVIPSTRNAAAVTRVSGRRGTATTGYVTASDYRLASIPYHHRVHSMKRTELKRKPGKIRDWQFRARQSGLRRTPRKQRQRLPDALLARIYVLNDGICAVCGAPCDPRRDRHHLLPVRLWPEYELVAENQVLLCLQDHMAHENAARRVSLEELPGPLRRWLVERGMQSGEIHAFIRRIYPPVGPADNQQEVQDGGERDREWPW